MGRKPIVDARIRLAIVGMAMVGVIALVGTIRDKEESNVLAEFRKLLANPESTAVSALKPEEKVEDKSPSHPSKLKASTLLERDDVINLHVDFGPPSLQEIAYDQDKVKFSAEYPLEAYRIRMKRKAIEESALEEAYKQRAEELEEGFKNSDRMRNCIMVLLILIVIITICFELTCSWILKNVSEFSRPVIIILFKELTVLGFIALLVFMSVKTGIPQSISRNIFGTPTELVEMFDLVHVMLFIVVVAFVILSSYALWRFGFVCRDWAELDRILDDAEDEGKPTEELLGTTYGPSQRRIGHDVIQFAYLRHNFLSTNVRNQHRFDPGFRLSRYLTKCTTETFEELVEVEAETWIVTVCLILLARLYSMVHQSYIKMAMLISVGVVILAINIILRNKCLKTYVMLARPGPISGDPLYVCMLKARPSTDGDVAGLPWWERLLGRKEAPLGGKRSPYEGLFWMGAYGPKLQLHIIRTSIFLIAVYGALLLLDLMHWKKVDGWHLIMLIAALPCPIMAMVHFIPQNLRLHVLCTSVELCRRREMIHEVEDEMRERRHFFVSRMVMVLKSHACRLLNRSAAEGTAGPSSGALDSSRATDTSRNEEIRELFEAFQEPPPGQEAPGELACIPASKADQFFRMLGVTVREDELDDMVEELGRGPDGQPAAKGILLRPALEWLAAMEQPRLSDAMIDAVFVDIDGAPPGGGLPTRPGASRWDNIISEEELVLRLAGLHPYFAAHDAAEGPPRGEGQRALREWLEWARRKCRLQCDFVDGHGRLFTPHAFRTLLKEGTQVGGCH